MTEQVTVITPIQIRFGDIDIFHHVNNVSQQSYLDLGKMDYFEKVAGVNITSDTPRIVAVSTATNYFGQIRVRDDIAVVTCVEKIGNKSLTLLQRIVCGDEVRTESRSVMVAFDFDRQISVPVPDEWRDKMLGQTQSRG